MSTTPIQTKFIELVKKKEALHEESKLLGEELEKLMTEIGMGTMFQDPTDKTVYQIHQPTGQFIPFKTIDYKRTNRTGENRGGIALAKKDATEAGFAL